MPNRAAPARSLEIAPPAPASLAVVVRRHGIRLLLAFGSRVHGTAHPGSDLDLAVLLRNPGRNDSWALLADLQPLFPGQEVDLVWLHRADPLLAWHVCRNARLLFGDARDFEERRAYAWRRFVEYDRFFERERQAVRAGIAQLRHAG